MLPLLLGLIQSYNGGQIICGNTSTPVAGGGIIRASSITGCDWEDGHLGNSEALIFTPSDFLCANPAAGRVGAITTAFVNVCNNGTGWNGASGGRFGTPSLCTATAADVIVATKLIPKGFQILDTDTITIHALTNHVSTRVAVVCRNVDNPVGVLGNPAQIAPCTFNTPQLLTSITGLNGTVPTG